MRIVGDDKDAVAQHCDTTIDSAGRIACQVFRLRPGVSPDLAAGAGVQGVGGIHLGDVHHAVDDDRRHFERVAAAHGVDPFGCEILNVARSDLGELGVAIAVFLSVIGGPLAGFGIRDIVPRNSLRQLGDGFRVGVGLPFRCVGEKRDEVACFGGRTGPSRHVGTRIAIDAGDFRFPEQVQAVIKTLQLDIFAAFVADEASHIAAFSEVNGGHVVSIDAASTGFAQRCFDFGQREFAGDFGEIRTVHAAPAPDHMAFGAVAAAEEHGFAGVRVA